MSINFAFIVWDWKGRPDIEEINAAVHDVYDGEHCPSIILVPDSGGDEFVATISSQTITPEIAQRVWGLVDQTVYCAGYGGSNGKAVTMDEASYGT